MDALMTRAEFVEACPSVLALWDGSTERLGTAMARVDGTFAGRSVGSGMRLDYRSQRCRMMVARHLVSRALMAMGSNTFGLVDSKRWIGSQVDERMPSVLIIDGDGFTLTVLVPADVRNELNALADKP